jgi:hypothetical protein
LRLLGDQEKAQATKPAAEGPEIAGSKRSIFDVCNFCINYNFYKRYMFYQSF